MSDLCLTLVCPREMEEKLLDALLTHAEDAVFTSAPVFSHGLAPARLSGAEKVMGRSRSVQVQVLTTTDDLPVVIDALRQKFPGAGLRYWVSGLVSAGEVA